MIPLFGIVAVEHPDFRLSRLGLLGFKFSNSWFRRSRKKVSQFVFDGLDYHWSFRSGCLLDICFRLLLGLDLRPSPPAGDLILEFDDSLDQGLGTRRTAGDVDINRQELVGTLDDVVLPFIDERPSGIAQFPRAMTHFGSGIWS